MRNQNDFFIPSELCLTHLQSFYERTCFNICILLKMLRIRVRWLMPPNDQNNLLMKPCIFSMWFKHTATWHHSLLCQVKAPYILFTQHNVLLMRLQGFTIKCREGFLTLPHRFIHRTGGSRYDSPSLGATNERVGRDPPLQHIEMCDCTM
jgi:hypothetical protein